jgi:hypothetical protein
MAVSVRVTTTGDKAAAATLSRVGAAAFEQAPVMASAARRTARGVRGIPVDTGRLAASPEVLDSGPFGFVVGSRVPYARYVFHGTRYMAARPPRVPSNIGADTADTISAAIVRA